MSSRRRRVLVYTERGTTLNDLKNAVGRSAELITATDLATVEAALRLYQPIDAAVVEKSGERNTPITVLRLTERTHPTARRVALVEHAAIKGVFDAVHDRTIKHLMFLPFSSTELRESIGLDPEPTVSAGGDPRGVMPVLRRAAFSQPPLTGGIKASSSPSLST